MSNSDLATLVAVALVLLYFYTATPAAAVVHPAAPTPQPQPAPVAAPTVDMDAYRQIFDSLVANQPFSQQTLLSIEPQLNASNILLTGPNAAGERTKIGLPLSNGARQWVRVGFGEGHWVWIPQ